MSFRPNINVLLVLQIIDKMNWSMKFSRMILFSSICKPVRGMFFVNLFFLNLISSSFCLYFDFSWFSSICVLCLSASVSYLESLIFLLLNRYGYSKFYAVIVFSIYYVLIVVESFMLYKFQLIINYDFFVILSATNSLEIINFVETYLKLKYVLFYILYGGGVFVLVFVLSKIITSWCYERYAVIISCIGFLIWLLCIWSFILNHDGLLIPQYSTLTRSTYLYYHYVKKKQEIVKLRETCKNVEVAQTDLRKPTIVVILGESFSVYHSSLYGYEKITNPLLSKRISDGSMVVFDNVVSLYDGTSPSMEAIFSLDSLKEDYTTKAMFPACFKSAGYFTALYDNECLVNKGLSFLADKEWSDLMFDVRNEKGYQYDGQMIDEMLINDSISLYVIHLWGQHYAYEKRYPKSFLKFEADDYDIKFSKSQREIIAHYDNATLYNDYVVNEILNKFKDSYCCVFYLSDHGEEVFELRDYMGHGNAKHSPNLNYQIRIPLFVWFSPSFLSENGNLMEIMKERVHDPICSDDIGHTLLDVAGISTKDFAPSRSFVNKKFNRRRHRVVLNSIDYDDYYINNR